MAETTKNVETAMSPHSLKLMKISPWVNESRAGTIKETTPTEKVLLDLISYYTTSMNST